jgi:tellurite resistance protein TerC
MSVLAWLVLVAVAVGCVGVDLFLSRRQQAPSMRSSLVASGLWTLAGLGFAPVVLAMRGGGESGHYLSAFVLEKTLSLDNVAMFAAVLGATTLSASVAKRVLDGGLLGALLLRIGFIAAGLAVVDAIHVVMLGFAVVLAVSGVRMLRPHPKSTDAPASGPARWIPTSIRRRPALAALVAITVVDVAFAADSILAAFAVTTSAYAIIAANVFAVLGLRPLYVVLNGALERFRYLSVGIGLLLVALGVELAVEHFVALPSWLTLAAVATALVSSIGASLLAERAA